MFAFGPGNETAGDLKPLYNRGEAEARASTVLAAKIKALPEMVLEAGKPAGPEAEELEYAVETDQQLASMVLAAGDSAFFRRGTGSPRNLLELLERAGAAAFRSLTFAAMFYRDMADALPWYAYSERGLWRHTMATSIASWRLGEALKLHRIACEMLFFAALFHDVGKPTIQELLATAPPAEDVSQGGQLTVLESERRIANMTHTELVPLILDIWGIEHSVFGVAEHHHAPQRAGTHALQASIVQLADVIANSSGIGLTKEYPFADAGLEKAAAKMNVDIGICTTIRDELGLLVAEVATQFDGTTV
jgi:HD-like signal output (HDOD) protein